SSQSAAAEMRAGRPGSPVREACASRRRKAVPPSPSARIAQGITEFTYEWPCAASSAFARYPYASVYRAWCTTSAAAGTRRRPLERGRMRQGYVTESFAQVVLLLLPAGSVAWAQRRSDLWANLAGISHGTECQVPSRTERNGRWNAVTGVPAAVVTRRSMRAVPLSSHAW